jgi:phosphatidylglycerophosphate synthase
MPVYQPRSERTVNEAAVPTCPAKPVRPQRPRELQDGLNYYLYHPLAWQLARLLAKTPLTPNMVSLVGAAMVIGAGFAYAAPGWPLMALLGMALHMGWHVVDGADGDLARLTGRTSPVGEMVDGLCDYLSHLVLYVLLGGILARTEGVFGGWHAGVLILIAALSHAVQSNHVEVQRRQYQYWVYSTPWLRMSHGQSDSATSQSWAAALVSAYIGVASGMTPHALRIDAAVAAAQGDPEPQSARGGAGPVNGPGRDPAVVSAVSGGDPQSPACDLATSAQCCCPADCRCYRSLRCWIKACSNKPAQSAIKSWRCAARSMPSLSWA